MVYGDGSVGVARVFLFDLLRSSRVGILIGTPIQFAHRRIERKLNVVPNRYVAGRLPVAAQVAAFQITKMPDVVNRLVAPLNLERPFARGRQSRALVEQRIEDHSIAAVPFAPHAEVSA